MKLKKAKKGFTLVELVVVIAIIAVLSTVSVVGYFGFTKKANVSGDKALVSQLNTILKAKETETGSKPETATEAIGYVEEQGINVAKLKPLTSKYLIAWNSEANEFALLNESKELVTGKLSSTANLNWLIASSYSVTENTGYSVYLMPDYKSDSTLNITTGLDVGENTSVEVVNYTNESSTAKSVVIRTNGGELTVNAPLDTVEHYEKADKVTITAVAGNSYHENGEVKDSITISAGRVVLENESKVKEVNISNATNDVKIESNVEVVISVDENSKEKTNVVANSDNIYVSGISSDKVTGSKASNVTISTDIDSTEALKNAVSKSGFYRFSQDFTLTERISVAKNAKVILDFNGKKLTYANNWLFAIDGDLTIMDSVGTGKIIVGKGAFENHGNLTINGCEIEATTRSGSTIKSGADTLTPETVYPDSKLIINNVNINTNNNYAVYNYTYFELNGGEIHSTSSSRYGDNNWGYCVVSGNYDKANFVANGGNVTGIQGAIGINSGSATINDVTAITKNSEGYKDSYYALYIAGEKGKPTCTINGGYFSAGERQALYIGNENDGGEGNLAACTVNAGTFVSPAGVECVNYISESESNYGLGFLAINGGKFSSDVSTITGVKTCKKDSASGLYIVNA